MDQSAKPGTSWQDRDLALEQEDLLAIRSTGAYGFTMSSNYNTRPRAAEILVDGEQTTVIRKRETIECLFANEACCQFINNDICLLDICLLEGFFKSIL